MKPGWKLTLTVDARQEPFDGRRHSLTCEAALVSVSDFTFLTLAVKTMEDFQRLVREANQATT